MLNGSDGPRNTLMYPWLGLGNQGFCPARPAAGQEVKGGMGDGP